MKLAAPPVLVVYESPCSSRGRLFPPGPEGERAVRHGQRHPGLRLARQVQERTEEPSRLHGETFPLESKSRAQLFVVVLSVCVCAVRIPTLKFEGNHGNRLERKYGMHRVPCSCCCVCIMERSCTWWPFLKEGIWRPVENSPKHVELRAIGWVGPQLRCLPPTSVSHAVLPRVCPT